MAESYVAIPQRKKNGRIMLESNENRPLVYLIIEENDQVSNKKYAKLTKQEKLQDECEVQALNIVLQVIKGNAISSGGNNATGLARVVKCYNYQEAQESGHVLNEKQLAFLADLGIADSYDNEPTIIHNTAFQTDDLDSYNFDCDDISFAKAVLMTNLSSYGLDVLFEDCREMQQGFIHEYNENLVLKAELAKREQMVKKKMFDEVVLRCSQLENHNVNLELKLQHQKGSFLNNRSFNNQNTPDILEIFKINE
nr:hypothetical protein [Tanacetum cinerariifolium]